jgi:hypothetical protein
MNTTRFQHLIPAGIIFILAAVVTWLSFTEEPVESFLFPRAISVFFIALALWNLVRAASGLSKVGGGMSVMMIKNVLPGTIIMIIFVFWAAKGLGFYVASWISFFTLYSLYDPAPWSSSKTWIKRIIITAAFMAVIYGLFSLVLQVRTPTGLFF